ncbi:MULTISPECIES: hypothetical protein [unclassified Sphingomonas]|nr:MULTISPECIES: hypothetical protein [unclassified Sphingomonas]
MMPTRIRIDRPNPTPESDAASFAKSWAKDPANLDVKAVRTAWRNQSA